MRQYPVGLNYHGYVIEQVQPVPEFSLVAVKLRHERTGSQHFHLDAPNDKNNVFSVAFKTNPPDATGVPHILEHTTLCGSYTYPVRDPFFKMLNRSLSNFMNAMTGHDYTYFPFATTNPKDFENLMDVYLSSVFEPLLTYEDFTQEGWRLENEIADNKSSALTFKGVVYNEMKGQYSNSAYYYWMKFQEAIYPSLKNSGGDPKKITSLQYEDLLDFHASCYHPSNAKTFTYGSLPLFKHLEKLNAVYGPFGARGNRNVIKQPSFGPTTPSKEVSVPGPVDIMSGKPIEEQYKSSITWYLGDPLDPEKEYDIFKWKVLNSLLCDGHSSPFYQELIEKEYGDDFTINSGLDATTALLSFTIGVNNLSKEKAEGLESKVRLILNDRVLPLFESDSKVFKERVEAILHQLELNFKKHKPDFGLGLLHSIIPNWINDADPVKALEIERILDQFKEEYKSSGLQMFNGLLKNSLLDENQPIFKFTMTPDETFSEKLAEEEAERLNKKVEVLEEEDRTIILDRAAKLAEKQQKEEDVSVLPTLTLHDIPRKGDFYKLNFGEVNSKKVQKRIVDTNGLAYVTAAKDFTYLPSKFYPYMPLFISCLTNLAGTSKTSVIDMETKIQKLTGGVSFSLSNKTNPYNISETNLKFVASGMALTQNVEHVFNIWREILFDTKFDNEPEVVDKLNTLIKNLGQNLMNNIAERGHSYSSSYSNSQLTTSKNIKNFTSGLGQVDFVMELNSKLESKGKEYLIEEILPVLREIQGLVTKGFTNDHKPGFEYNLIGDSNAITESEQQLQKFDDFICKASTELMANQLEEFKRKFESNNPNDQSTQTLINLPFQTGYSSLARSGAEYASQDGAVLQVLAQLLSFKHLHSVIREANGAYGGGMNFDGLGGTINFYSYRDPNPLKSVKSYRDSYQIALDKLESNWDEADLQEAKLSIFQSVDAPSHVALQGVAAFIDGITDSMRQERREHFLYIDNEDLKQVTEKYLVGQGKEAVTVIGDNSHLKVKDEDWNIKNYS